MRSWKEPILTAYASRFDGSIEHLDYFYVLVVVKLLASTVISFLFGPEELGLRPEALAFTEAQLSIYSQLSQRIRDITGLGIPELEHIFEKISGGTGNN